MPSGSRDWSMGWTWVSKVNVTKATRGLAEGKGIEIGHTMSAAVTQGNEVARRAGHSTVEVSRPLIQEASCWAISRRNTYGINTWLQWLLGLSLSILTSLTVNFDCCTFLYLCMLPLRNLFICSLCHGNQLPYLVRGPYQNLLRPT
jgi:hypothetical protein